MIIIQAIKKIQEYAEENNVPIMTNEGITFLTDYVRKYNIKRILEIGTAIGLLCYNDGFSQRKCRNNDY